jgi:hypothetical protein
MKGVAMRKRLRNLAYECSQIAVEAVGGGLSNPMAIELAKVLLQHCLAKDVDPVDLKLND